MLILEEAAYVDPSFFYETVAPLTIVGNTSLLAISTLTSEVCVTHHIDVTVLIC